jgi:RNA polymerase sigma-70 factor (ECF subfamily)
MPDDAVTQPDRKEPSVNGIALEATLDPPATSEPGYSSPEPVTPADTTAVVQRYQKLVFGLALSHTRCRGDAEDAFQEVFLAYHRKQPDCKDEDHRQAWLITTTLNVARRIAQSSWRTRVVPLTQDQAGLAPDAARFHFSDPRQDDLFAAFATLPETYRGVLHLFYFDDLPVARIAQVLDLEPATVKMRLSRGRAILRGKVQGVNLDD